MIEFLKTLFMAPVSLPWILLILASATLLAPSLTIAYIVALVHAHIGKSWRGVLMTKTRIRISWVWGWIFSAIILILYMVSLSYLDRLDGWIAGLPYLITAEIAILIATILRRSVRRKVVTMQRNIQGSRS